MKMVMRYSIGVIVLIIIALRIYFHDPNLTYSGEKEISGLQQTVDIFTDNYGVPHIFAQNESDLFFAAGYQTARDRLFQISLVVSASRGSLAAFFGDNYLKDDIYLRTWGIHKTAKEILNNTDQKTIKTLQSTCDGINARIDELDGKYPLEFKLLRVKPLKIKPVDIIAYGRLMAHDLQQSWKPEILFGLLLEYLGSEKLNELFPIYEPFRPTISEGNKYKNLKLLFSSIWNHEIKIRDLTGANGVSIGSNSWVVSGKKSTTGKPILANDPHLKFTQPSKWYEMHLKGGAYNVSGAFLPGFPLPVLGQNEKIAWGFTNIMADDIDFFIEKIHPENPNKYKHDNKWLDIVSRKETISLKEGKDTTIIIRETHHGPIISDIHPLLKEKDYAISMSWVGNKITNEISALSKFSLVKNWNEFSTIVSEFSVPGQNIIYADTLGNIGWRAAALIPIRKDGGSLLPRPGWDSDYDWKGFIPFDEMPYIYNPKKGYIATANNKIVDDSFPYYISNQWAEPSRIERIEEWIESKEKLSPNDMKLLQNDRLSSFAREVTPNILKHLPNTLSGNQKTAYEYLINWDFIESPNSSAALVFHVILDELLNNIYKDELDLVDEKAFDALVHFSMLPYRNIHWVLSTGKSSWIDDVRTKNKTESIEEIIISSFERAINRIENEVGVNPTVWSWGALHTLTHPHPLGKIKLLDLLFGFNVGPYTTGGSSMTVNKGEYEVLDGFDQSVGASFRRIVDMNNMNLTQFIIPTGQSGQQNSPHYLDQAHLYNKGLYRTTYMDENFIRTSNLFKHLILHPKR